MYMASARAGWTEACSHVPLPVTSNGEFLSLWKAERVKFCMFGSMPL